MKIAKVFILILSLLPVLAHGVGFGEIKVYSYRNEPFDAEIELLDAASIEPEKLVVKLASMQEFKEVELTRPSFWSQLRFEVNRKGPRTFIKVSTAQAIKQSLVELLINLTWPNGRLSRGYTILIEALPSGAIPISERRTAFEKKQLETLSARQKRQSERKSTVILSSAETFKLDNDTLTFNFETSHEEPQQLKSWDSSKNDSKNIESSIVHALTVRYTPIDSSLQIPLLVSGLRGEKIEIPEGAILINPAIHTSRPATVAMLASQEVLHSSIYEIFKEQESQGNIAKEQGLGSDIAAGVVLATLVKETKTNGISPSSTPPSPNMNQTTQLNSNQLSIKPKPISFLHSSQFNRFLIIGLLITGIALSAVVLMLISRRKQNRREQHWAGLEYNRARLNSSQKTENYSQEYFSEEALVGIEEHPEDFSKTWSSNIPYSLSGAAEEKLNANQSLDESFDQSPEVSLEDLDIQEDRSFKFKTFPNEFKLKLDLASQYLTINDQENALHLFKEVLLYGNQHEKEQAEKLMENIEVHQFKNI